MTLIRYGWMVAILMLAGGPALALEDRVEALQQPAWVVSGVERSAAFPGQELGPQDQVVTGETGKLWLLLAEGSRVKLGNGAELELDVKGMSDTGKDASGDAAANEGSDGFYEAALDVLVGAFRFTTTELGKRFDRAVDIQAGPVATIGIRGTDVWGRARADSSFVALIEGQISITRRNGSSLQVNEPLTVFQASTGEPRGKAELVTLEAVQQLAPETELDRGAGVLVEDGPYAVHLMSFRDSDSAESAAAELRQAGYAGSVVRESLDGQRWHRVSVMGFETLEDARSFRRQAVERDLAESPWVGHSS